MLSKYKATVSIFSEIILVYLKFFLNVSGKWINNHSRWKSNPIDSLMQPKWIHLRVVLYMPPWRAANKHQKWKVQWNGSVKTQDKRSVQLANKKRVKNTRLGAANTTIYLFSQFCSFAVFFYLWLHQSIRGKKSTVKTMILKTKTTQRQYIMRNGIS